MSSTEQNEAATRYIQQYDGGGPLSKTTLAGAPFVGVETTLDASGQTAYRNARLFTEYAAGTTPATANHVAAKAATELTLGINADDIAALMGAHAHYSQGGTQTVRITGVLGAQVANVVHEIGLSDWDSSIGTSADTANGVVLRRAGDGTLSWVLKRPTALGGDIVTAQADWDDRCDGSGASRLSVDFTKDLILGFRYKHLGYEGVVCGFEKLGRFVVAHRFALANTATLPFWDNPNLHPFWLAHADGVPAGASTMLAGCHQHTVSDGTEVPGFSYDIDRATFASLTTTLLPIVAIRLKEGRENRAVIVKAMSIYAGAAGATRDIRGVLLRNATVTGGAWADVDTNNSALQVNTTGTSVANGVQIGAAATGSSSGAVGVGTGSADVMGIKADGTSEEIVLAVQTFTSTADGWGKITVEEKP